MLQANAFAHAFDGNGEELRACEQFFFGRRAPRASLPFVMEAFE
jgi:hypothetical protein